jgi:hypothetical protein
MPHFKNAFDGGTKNRDAPSLGVVMKGSKGSGI